MTAKVLAWFVIASFVLLSPAAIADMRPQGDGPDPASWIGAIEKLGPVGATVLGIIACAAWVARAAKSALIRWLDAGSEEREAMRDLAKILKDRFEEDHLAELRELKEAVRSLRSGGEKQ